jgi:hypothetical protein
MTANGLYGTGTCNLLQQHMVLKISCLPHMCPHLLPTRSRLVKLKLSVKDTSGSLLLAFNQKISAFTKHFLVDWHFFLARCKWSSSHCCSNWHQGSAGQCLTKGLTWEFFELNHKSLQDGKATPQCHFMSHVLAADDDWEGELLLWQAMSKLVII